MGVPQLRDADSGTGARTRHDRRIPTTGLLASVLVSKFADHLPLYHQEQIFARAGLAIPRPTLGAWVETCGAQLLPLVDALHQEILQQGVLHADETPVQILRSVKGRGIGPSCGPIRPRNSVPFAPRFTTSSAGVPEHARANVLQVGVLIVKLLQLVHMVRL